MLEPKMFPKMQQAAPSIYCRVAARLCLIK